MDSSLFMNKECHYAFRCLRSQLILQPIVIYGPGSKKINKLYFVGVCILVNLTSVNYIHKFKINYYR